MFTALSFSSLAIAKQPSFTDCKLAEKSIDGLSNWAGVYDAYVRYTPMCDDGEIAEGFSDRIVHLLASNWNSLPELHRIVRHNARFKRFILKHIDATSDTDELKTIVEQSRLGCKFGSPPFCEQLYSAALAAMKDSEEIQVSRPN